MTLPANIRVNVGAPFPTRVLGATGIKVSKQNGVWTVQADFGSLPLTAGVINATFNQLWVYNSQTGIYSKMSLAGLTLESAIEFVIDGQGSGFSTGLKGYIEVPFNCSINRATLLGDAVGNCVIDIYKTTYAAFPPTAANSICAAAKPTLAAARSFQDTTLTGWTLALTKGDVVAFNVDSVSGLTRVTASLGLVRT